MIATGNRSAIWETPVGDGASTGTTAEGLQLLQDPLLNRGTAFTEAERDEILGLFHRVGLTIDHELFDVDCLNKGTAAILQTRDGKQRFVVPRPIGTTHFVNDASDEELAEVLHKHKALCKEKFGGGEGTEAYVDAGDLVRRPSPIAADLAGHRPVQAAQAGQRPR